MTETFVRLDRSGPQARVFVEFPWILTAGTLSLKSELRRQIRTKLSWYAVTGQTFDEGGLTAYLDEDDSRPERPCIRHSRCSGPIFETEDYAETQDHIQRADPLDERRAPSGLRSRDVRQRKPQGPAFLPSTAGYHISCRKPAYH